MHKILLATFSIILALTSTALPMTFQIHKAAEIGDFEQLCALLAQDPASVNAVGPLNWTPLHFAANNGRTNCVQELLQHHADVDAKSSINWTPLHCAACWNHFDCVKLLLQNDANVKAKTNYNKTAKDLAQENSHEDVVELLQIYEDLLEIKEPEEDQE